MITTVVARIYTFHLLYNALLLTLALMLNVAARAQSNDDAARTAAELTSLTAEIAAIQALLGRASKSGISCRALCGKLTYRSVNRTFSSTY